MTIYLRGEGELREEPTLFIASPLAGLTLPPGNNKLPDIAFEIGVEAFVAFFRVGDDVEPRCEAPACGRTGLLPASLLVQKSVIFRTLTSGSFAWLTGFGGMEEVGGSAGPSELCSF